MRSSARISTPVWFAAGPRGTLDAMPGTTEDGALRLALSAFHAAVGRVTAVPASAEASLFAPLTEAAWWAVSVDDGLEARDGYRKVRNSTPTGRTVVGLRYARNVLGHHRAFIAEPSAGLTVPYTIPYTITVVPRWLGTHSLPEMGNQGLWAEPYYTDRLARRAVLETLAEAAEWFAAAAPDLAP